MAKGVADSERFKPFPAVVMAAFALVRTPRRPLPSPKLADPNPRTR